MDYRLVARNHPNELAKVISKYLREGWMLRGNTEFNNGKYTQEVIRSGRPPLDAQSGNAETRRVPDKGER